MKYSIKDKETPLMKQYNRIKSIHPGTMLLFRVGDFYETFGEDAIKASQVLNIVLTKRANGAASSIELAGFPHHALDNYVPKLVKAGFRVAICDQLEDPKYAKGIVKRGITELITPGLTYNDNVLDKNSNNFLCAIHQYKDEYGVAFLDLSTGEFLTSQGDENYMLKLFQSFDPKEILCSKKNKKNILSLFKKIIPSYILEDWFFDHDYAYEKLVNQFKTNSLKGFGIEDLKLGIVSSGAIMRYLEETENNKIKHINAISKINPEKFVWLDDFTIKNLELISTQHHHGVPLINTINETLTSMGARLLKKWLLLPLKSINDINERLNVVQVFVDEKDLNVKLSEHLKKISDLERLSGKLVSQRISPRELISLKNSLMQLKPIKKLIKEHEKLKTIFDEINDLDEIIQLIDKNIEEDAPISLSQGNIIKLGIDSQLDELKNLSKTSEDYLEKFRIEQIESTGISSLKISFNKIFGYYIEVTNTHKNKVPQSWVRRQTLVNAERYITEELKEYEDKILNAQEKITSIEQNIYKELIEKISLSVNEIQQTAKIVAKIDCLLSFSNVAIKNNYCRPEINDQDIIKIEAGRHPVIEQTLGIDKIYVPNDVYLDNKKQQIIIITGPNMAGKSAFLRQTALITLLAQIGCFVPASKATIGIIHKISIRVGASDNISRGESTFMVEMNETSNILNNLTPKSLVIMDEIGRGTSTYDGISIAKAIVEHLHEHKYHPKVLFATHYHELNEISSQFKKIKNYNVEVKEKDDNIIFTHKLVPGGAEHSFGINVAEMAGLPPKIIQRAKIIMNDLEKLNSSKKRNINSNNENPQLKLFEATSKINKVEQELKKIDLNTLSPLEALLKLNELKELTYM